MNEEDYYMSAKEIARRDVIKRCIEEKLPRAKAAEILNISVRHVKRLLSAYRKHGDDALISKRRDQPSNNKIADEIKDLAIELIRGEQYKNYGPTLAHEHLFEYHADAFDRPFSIETLRQWMIDAGLHDRKQRRAVTTHQSRPRQAGFGMLIQIDGSPHPWFEKRGAPCTLIAFVDDATSTITALHFCAAETTADYMQTLKQHLQRYGCPMALYSDRHSIFSNNAKERHTFQQSTQFERALQQLGTKLYKAKSPQAKGRVERAFRILQDRLVKAMRLHDICTIEQANQFAEQYRQKYNQRFAKQPLDSSDYHRPVLHNERQLALVLSQQCERKLSKTSSVSIIIYSILSKPSNPVMPCVAHGSRCASCWMARLSSFTKDASWRIQPTASTHHCLNLTMRKPSIRRWLSCWQNRARVISRSQTIHGDATTQSISVLSESNNRCLTQPMQKTV